MSIRKTESRIPANFQPSDLGQAVAAGDGRMALVSFITSPLVLERENVYVLFVTDAALATATQSFEWSFTENGGTPNTQTTQRGEASYRPQATGSLNLTVRLLGAGNAEQARITLEQEVIELQADLEALITGARDSPGPGVGNPEVARELVNDHSPYYQDIALRTPEDGEGFHRFLFSIVYDGALQRPAARRKQHLDQLAASLNDQGAGFATLAAEGAGLCGIRLALLAMTLPRAPGDTATVLEWTELPEAAAQRIYADEQLRQSLAALEENKRLDLFNLVRFPKSNITQCGRILEALRDHYFSGTNFNDVLTGMQGTRAHWITRHFREGPLRRSST
jgi:hypothetical protein